MGLLAGTEEQLTRRKRRRKHHKKKHHQQAPHHGATPRPTPSSPVPIPTPANPVVSPNALHLARRFSFGFTPELGSAINAAGGARAWFVQQLNPAAVPDPTGDQVDSWFDFLGRTPREIWQRQSDGTEGAWVVMWKLSKWTVARRIHSSRQVQEVMVDFWSNLFNVPLGNGDAAFARVDYDKVIRAAALTSFEQLLQAVITAPAMGINLSNNVSRGTNVNENLGRELLELHTVGFGAGYTEDDVKASAKMLTGYRVTPWPYQDYGYYPAWHYVGALDIFGFHDDNASADGRAATSRYLSFLARHPKTAARIARRLCVRFVGDSPTQAMVDAVTAAYTASGTDIRTTLLAIVDHPDFNAAAGTKLRNPQEDWQAMVRALGITLQAPADDGDFVNAMYWQYQELGAAPYEWAAPNGYPEVNAAWSSAGRMLNSFSNHRDMTFHWWPSRGAGLPDVRTYLPPLPATLQNVVDVLGVRILGETPTATTAQAVAALTGWPLTRTITATDANRWWFTPGVVSTLLDSPQHLYR